MDPRLLLAIQLLQTLPTLLEAGASVTALIEKHTARLQDMATTGRKPTDQEWDELNAEIEALRAELHQE
jgi:branched-subunit amino acid aminotransferase/4-amino-4-deoxychorismate lyase